MLNEIQQDKFEDSLNSQDDSLSKYSQSKDDPNAVIQKKSKTPDWFECQILSQNNWSLSTTTFQIPLQVRDKEDDLIASYTEKFSKRKLMFNYTHSTCVIEAKYLPQPLLITTSQSCALTLLKFNDVESIEENLDLKPLLRTL